MTLEIFTKSERTRQAIVDATYRLILEQGYAATSMRQIAENADVALGGIYHHFNGKEAIFSALIIEKHPFNEIFPLLQAAPGDTVEEFVRNAARSMVTVLGNRPDFIKFLLVELVEFHGRDIPKMYQRIFPQIAPLIARFEIPSGVIRPIPPMILFRVFLGVFFSFYITEYLLAGTPAAATQENALDHFVDIFLHGILATKELA